MGGVLLVYGGTVDGLPASVEITADRGTMAGAAEVRRHARRRSCRGLDRLLDATDVHDMAVDDQATFVRDRLGDAAAAFRQNPEAAGKLTEIGRAMLIEYSPSSRKSFENP